MIYTAVNTKAFERQTKTIINETNACKIQLERLAK